MNEITIKNITQKDYQRTQIRILADQKEMFPPERPGYPNTYNVTINWKGDVYECDYRIGSKDGKQRSGILRLKNGLPDALGNRVGKILILQKITNNEYNLNDKAL